MNGSYVLVGVVALVVGAAFGYTASTHVMPVRQDIANAEAVDAVVVSSSVVETTNAEGQSSYHPEVTYRYSYEGTEYTSSSVFPGDLSHVSDRERAAEIANRYDDGEEVTAHVNSRDPSRAYLLEQGAPWWFWLGPVVGVLVMLYGLYAILQGVRGVEQADFA